MSTGALALVGPRVEPPLGGGGADGRYEVMVVVVEVMVEVVVVEVAEVKVEVVMMVGMR